MNPSALSPPTPGEYAPFYAGYIDAVRDADVSRLLAEQEAVLHAMCGSLPEAGALQRYAPGKWSVKEVVGHLADAERIFGYRMLRISRGDPTPLAGFDENAYIQAAGFDRRPLAEIVHEFGTVRAATLILLRSLRPQDLERRALANGFEVSVRALAYITVGHVEHHFRVLRERYGIVTGTNEPTRI